MNISPLTAETLPAALAYLRRSPYRNALLLSNVSQLRERCDVLVAERAGDIVGVVSTYHDLPTPNLIFAASSETVVQPLVERLAERNSQLRGRPVMALLPEERFRQISRFSQVVEYELEYQMGVEPETLRAPNAPVAKRLSHADLPAMSALAKVAELAVWSESAFHLGPAFGCFVGERLVAMAATHYATTEVIEIGHVATHPEFRGRGYAKAATAALAGTAFTLAPRVFLMVLEHNMAARAAYRAIGFYPIEKFYLARFRL